MFPETKWRVSGLTLSKLKSAPTVVESQARPPGAAIPEARPAAGTALAPQRELVHDAVPAVPLLFQAISRRFPVVASAIRSERDENPALSWPRLARP